MPIQAKLLTAFALSFAFLMLMPACFADSSGDDQPTVDFSRDIRPLFNQHCIACHGGVKQAAGLSLVYADQTKSLLEAGEPENSYLLERVVAEDDADRMPPAEHGRRLNDDEVESLKRWIRQGAVWEEHWSFESPTTHQIEVPEDAWSRQKLDRFVLSRLRQQGLTPSAEASPDRWLRRVSLDLTGLPPTPRQRTDFLQRLSKRGDAAYEEAVDRLLSSQRFGERWASVWLDAVRYADSKGLGQDGRRTIWKYRDWVIRALNDDMPYDQFTVRQLAGDLLESPTIDDQLATACNRLTQTNEEGGTDDEMFRVEAVIDRVNTVWQAWQGISFGCVQCHAHPYDPIRHEEYYEFAAFFNNTVDSDLSSDKPTLDVPLETSRNEEARRLDQQIEQLWRSEWRLAAEPLFDETVWLPLEGMSATTDNSTRVETAVVGGVEEVRTVGNVAKNTSTQIDAPLPKSLDALAAIKITGLPADETRALADSEWGFVLSHVQAAVVSRNGETVRLPIEFVIADEPDPLLDPQLTLNPESSHGFGAYSRIHYPRRCALIVSEPVKLEAGDRLSINISQNVFELGAFPLVARRLRFSVTGDPRLTRWWNDPTRVAARSRLEDIKRQRDQIPSIEIPVMDERPQRYSRPTHVFERGNYLSKDERVQADIPDLFKKDDAWPSGAGVGSSRADAARWIASTQNPLTARVAVNRVWAQLFGVGIVETQEDFGSSGARPSHPLLLDDLATRFQTEMGWSIKTLLRELVLSSTYRQTAQVSQEVLEKDPNNRLLSRGPRTRLPAETIRDQALFVSGLLSLKPFGPPVHPPLPAGVWKPFQGGDKWTTPPPDEADRYRRTVYTYTKRTIPYPVMASFDAPSREFCAVRRLPSNTPIQALMTLNDRSFVEASEALADRMRQHDGSIQNQLRFGFLLTVCRDPGDDELAELTRLYQRAVAHGENSAGREDAALTTVATVLLNLDEVLTK